VRRIEDATSGIIADKRIENERSSTMDVICALDISGRIIKVNSAFENTFGYEVNDVLEYRERQYKPSGKRSSRAKNSSINTTVTIP
jgi:PAS domain S-box-containing protein